MADKKYHWEPEPSTEEWLAKIGTSPHLTLDELVEYLFVHDSKIGKKFDEYAFKESFRVNTHIVKCPSCKKLYDALLLISGVGEVYTQIMDAANDFTNESVNQKERQKALEFIRYKVDYCNSMILGRPLESPST